MSRVYAVMGWILRRQFICVILQAVMILLVCDAAAGVVDVVEWTTNTTTVVYTSTTPATTPAQPIYDSSCRHRCDAMYVPGKPCYCNDACSTYENCCVDFYQLCRPDFVWSDEWQPYMEHKYKYFEDVEVTSFEAVQKCREYGALLVSINTAEEHQFVSLEVLKKRTLAVFIGGSDAEKAGSWMWSDGLSVPLPNTDVDEWSEWYEGQPDNKGGEEHCAVMTNYRFWDTKRVNINQYLWIDYSCTANIGKEINGYVCEAAVACDSSPCLNNGTCMYVGSNVEYRCLCPDTYVGDICQYQMLPGVTWTLCGETNLTGSSSGVVTSPLYPYLYPNNAVCLWTIEVEEGSTLQLDFEDFEVENGKNCSYDKLVIYDGDSMNDTVLVRDGCGNMTDLVKSTAIASSNNRVVVEFTTDDSQRHSGFKLAYSTQRCADGVGLSGCGTRKTFTSQCASISVKHGPSHRSREPCEWFIHVEDGSLVNLTFSEFLLKHTDTSCTDGHVAVYDGPNEDYQLLGRYCGHRFPWSIQSSGSQLYIQLVGDIFEEKSVFNMGYLALESSSFRKWSDKHTIDDLSSGRFSASDWPVNMQMSGINYWMWFIKGNPGDMLKITYEATLYANTTFKVYDGATEKSPLVLELSSESGILDELEDTLDMSMFQALIIVSYAGTQPRINISYTSQDWTPEVSGCYRPKYYNRPAEKSYENNLISPMQPVVIMTSQVTTTTGQPAYEPGMYCKWLLRGEGKKYSLSLDVLNMNLFPVTADCLHDGVVIYHKVEGKQTVYGPFCGNSILEASLHSLQGVAGDLIVVFYSAQTGALREGGQFRAIVSATDKTNNVYTVQEIESENGIIQSTKGIILSPGFPNLVKPGFYFWVVDSGDAKYHFNIYLYYVRGPALKDNVCSQTFKIIEVGFDATKLRQDEAEVVKLCGDTDVFIPSKTIKIPPKQKFGIELNTGDSSIGQLWQFKLAYEVDELPPPSDIIKDTDGEHCGDDEYYHFNGKCYRYYSWVHRHYNSSYSFQQTWFGSQEHCQQSNASLVNIHDLHTSKFLKYMLTNDWLFFSAYQVNAHMIFIGLSNVQASYQWMDNTQLSYAEWYTPGEKWEQPLFEPAHVGVEDVVSDDKYQPVMEQSMQCVAMLPISPFGSLNWVKIPCDYPMFMSGFICEKPAVMKTEEVEKEENQDNSKQQYDLSYYGCPNDYMMFNERCIQLFTNYTMVTNHHTIKEEMEEDSHKAEDMFYPGVTEFTMDEAVTTCQYLGGNLAFIDSEQFSLFTKYLEIWNHDELDGNIWLSHQQNISGNISSGSSCHYIHVDEMNEFSNKDTYYLKQVECGKIHHSRSILCETQATKFSERCGAEEFQCSNDICVSVDSRCDNVNDCLDNSDELMCGCGKEMYQCSNGKCIPISLYCDFVDHCGDNSDEQHCIAEVCHSGQFRCDNGECIPADNLCDFILHCKDHSDESTQNCAHKCNGMQCFSGQCISEALQHDMFPDCPGFAQEDELDTQSTLVTMFDVLYSKTVNVDERNKTFSSGCEMDGALTQCYDDHPKCYRRNEACIFDNTMVDESQGLQVEKSCRDGTHLRNNCDLVEHPGMFRCISGHTGYFIPLRKLCDGLQDCIGGEDEQDCQQYTCPGLFKCKGESNCISHREVCDGTVNCLKHREDEKYCHKQDVLCHNPGCSCQGFVVNCANSNLTTLKSTQAVNSTSLIAGRHNVRSLNLSGNQLQLNESSFRRYYYLGKLILSNNRLEDLPSEIFADLKNLFELDLSFNRLRSFQKGVFNGLTSLRLLDLSNNILSELTRDSLSGLSRISHLILLNNNLNIIPDDTLDDLTSLETINTDAFKFCCIAKHVPECTPQADEFSSCEDLMDSTPLQVSIWILGMLALVGNVFVIIWRMKKDRSKVSSFFIINLGFSDFLMGIYLLIIASVDVHYRGRYIIHADDWRNSALCQLAGVLATLSSEVSVFMLTAITCERVMAIIFPLKIAKMRIGHVRIVAGLGWVVGLFLSVLPLSNAAYFGDAFFGKTGVCLPFHLTDERLPGWEYSLAVFLVLNLISFIGIFIGYITIFFKVRTSARNMSRNSTGSNDEYALAKKLMFIVATDFVCWVPIILIGFAALGGAAIPPQVSAWIAVFVLPLNSSLNPILYTISALEFGSTKKRLRKYGTMATGKSNVSSANYDSVQDNYKPSTSVVVATVDNELSTKPMTIIEEEAVVVENGDKH